MDRLTEIRERWAGITHDNPVVCASKTSISTYIKSSDGERAYFGAADGEEAEWRYACVPDDIAYLLSRIEELEGRRCETCVEWEPKYDNYSDTEGYGVCLLSTKGSHESDERIIDATWSDSHVHTKPDFRCMYWREKK